MAPVSPLARQLRAGRTGHPDGPPGVVATELADIALASVAIRRGADAALAARLRAGLGLMPPTRPERVARGAVALVWAGPGQWLALSRGATGVARFAFAPELSAMLGDAASVTDLTGARAVLRLSGPRVRDALAKLVPIDLDDAAFPPGAAALTVGGHIGLHLWRLEGEVPAFDLACHRSYGGSLAEAVLHAAAEFGCETTEGR
jgi:sarcosine oxidase subunit gamma